MVERRYPSTFLVFSCMLTALKRGWRVLSSFLPLANSISLHVHNSKHCIIHLLFYFLLAITRVTLSEDNDYIISAGARLSDVKR